MLVSADRRRLARRAANVNCYHGLQKPQAPWRRRSVRRAPGTEASGQGLLTVLGRHPGSTAPISPTGNTAAFFETSPLTRRAHHARLRRNAIRQETRSRQKPGLDSARRRFPPCRDKSFEAIDQKRRGHPMDIPARSLASATCTRGHSATTRTAFGHARVSQTEPPKRNPCMMTNTHGTFSPSTRAPAYPSSQPIPLPRQPSLLDGRVRRDSKAGVKSCEPPPRSLSDSANAHLYRPVRLGCPRGLLCHKAELRRRSTKNRSRHGHSPSGDLG